MWSGPTGEIAATARPIGDAKVVPIAGDRQSVLQTEVEEEAMAELHLSHRVDPGRVELVRRPEAPTAE